jgi:very-short-patch-repair endonuclease/predicted transcriptional regulator of viral defense system
MHGKVVSPDEAIADLAARQHGVVAISQLRRIGLSEGAVRSRALAGRLHRIHRGVYAVGHRAISPEGRWLAAVLAIGGGPAAGGGRVLECWGAAVSHCTAACLWGLLSAADRPTDVMVSRAGGRRSRLGIRVHVSRHFGESDVTSRRGIPVTTPARTIDDLRRATAAGGAGALSARDLRGAIRQAEVEGLVVGEVGTDRTRSDLERDFLRLCRRHSLPAPEVNVRVGPHLVDFLWRSGRLVVETDGYRYHRGRIAFQDDRARDLDLRRLGYEVLRLSERQVNEEPGRVAEAVATALSR